MVSCKAIRLLSDMHPIRYPLDVGQPPQSRHCTLQRGVGGKGDNHWHACSAVQRGEAGRACFAHLLGHCHEAEPDRFTAQGRHQTLRQ